MKRKSFFYAISGLLLVMAIAGCAGSAKPAVDSGVMELDDAIQAAAVSINVRLDAGTRVALLNFESPTEQFSGYVLDELTANLVDSGNLVIVDRKEIDLIRGEFAFQYSGEVSDDSMQAIGRMLGAQSIVSGTLSRIGDLYRIVIRVLNVQSTVVEVQYRTDIANDGRVMALLTGGQAKNAGAQQQETYKIGDTGPGGGTVFLIEGNIYWEVSRNLGSHKWSAAKTAASSFRGGGFSDWYLPSKGELNFVYSNLQNAGIVNLGNDRYWSSSEYSNSRAWVQRFSVGYQDHNAKSRSYSVRAIRAF
jgi:TolB-like protein